MKKIAVESTGLFLLSLFQQCFSIDMLDRAQLDFYNPPPEVTGEYLYDLSTDPYESSNMALEVSYQENLATFQDLKTYWSDLTIPATDPDTTYKNNTFFECGRICPWIPDEIIEKVDIEQKYFYTDAPNIVYILVDDWGYNDFGKRSTYLGWTTPHIDKLADEGVLLTNYYTNEVCAPSRASLMTGRYSLRLGVYDNFGELPHSEVTLADELHSAGYRNYIVGKWHLGMSSYSYFPLQRGFDYFYGFVDGKMDYYTKESGDFLDLFENNDFVVDEGEISDDLHAAYLFQAKAESAIKYHADNYAGTPMFLYYAMQLIHEPWTAPSIYLSRCTTTQYTTENDETSTQENVDNYCAMNVMLDEAVANITCVLEANGMSENTVLIIAGDNGGEVHIPGNSYPFKGHKGSVMRGGISNTAIIHSNLIPKSVRGSEYSKLVHITDWLPSIMNLATNGEWSGSYTNADIDGVDIWGDITSTSLSSEKSDNERAFVIYSYNNTFSMQIGDMKYIYNLNPSSPDEPVYYYLADLDPSKSQTECPNPSLIDDEMSIYEAVKKLVYNKNTPIIQIIVLCIFVSTFGMVIVAVFVVALCTRDDEQKKIHGNILDPSREEELYDTYQQDEVSEMKSLL